MQANIAFSSLPEGDMPTAGAHIYSWTIPIPRVAGTAKSLSEDEGVAKDAVPTVAGNLYGVVYFVQEKITHQPSLVGLFTNTLSILGPIHFKHGGVGGGVVEAACHNIASWPDLIEGATLDLPLLGTIQTVAIPLAGQPQWSSPTKPNLQPVIQATLPLTPLSTSFHANVLSFSKILLLWELVLLGEPVLVFASDPRTGSDLVHHLRNLIRPIIFSGDCRPYFHIHDHDFSRIASTSKPPTGAILSTTNPLVLSTLKHWPHVLRAFSGTGTKKNQVDAKPPGLTTTRKRHLKKDAGVAKAVDRAFASGDCP
ncbi:hypothetical protein RQP46_004044 [Phenoliferia psychrophenolica]